MTNDLVITDRSLEYGPPPPNIDENNIGDRMSKKTVAYYLLNAKAFGLDYLLIYDSEKGALLTALKEEKITDFKQFNNMPDAIRYFIDTYEKAETGKGDVKPEWAQTAYDKNKKED